jgi:hypothetical protein
MIGAIVDAFIAMAIIVRQAIAAAPSAIAGLITLLSIIG